ncbi:MAG: hypothetical protein HOP18_04555 [Deltaproteobacteria bacterium]|nr:hypothetical protein [Deltaproteobacteria bacterium]
MAEPRNQHDLPPSFTPSLPFYKATLRGPEGERRLPVDVVKQELLALPSTTWIDFADDELGEPAIYALDLMRRLAPLKRQWIAHAHPRFLDNATLIETAHTSGCRGLIFDGVEIAAQHLTSEPMSTTESLAQLTRRFRTLPENGLLSIVHFVFGYDTDDEGVFERTMRFCLEARIGLPHFSLLTPGPGSALAATLAQEGRLLPNAETQGDGAHAVFRPRLMTPEALENGLRWTRQQVYRSRTIWQRVGGWNRGTFQHLLANHTQRRMFQHEQIGVYTEAMRLLSHLSQPIQVQERASFISTLHDAVGETRRHLQGALLRTRVIRDEPLKAVTLCLEGVLDASGAKEVLHRIHETIRAGHHKVVLDLKGLESISPTVITRFLEENAQALIALRDRVVFRHLRSVLAVVKANLGGVLPNAELFELVSEES